MSALLCDETIDFEDWDNRSKESTTYSFVFLPMYGITEVWRTIEFLQLIKEQGSHNDSEGTCVSEKYKKIPRKSIASLIELIREKHRHVNNTEMVPIEYFTDTLYPFLMKKRLLSRRHRIGKGVHCENILLQNFVGYKQCVSVVYKNYFPVKYVNVIQILNILEDCL